MPSTLFSVYNAQLLKQEIDTFKKLKAKFFVSSHNMEEYKTKDEVINYLESIYSRREKSNSYISAKI